MKKLNLVHEKTPPSLLGISQELESLLQSEDDIEARLFELIVQRDELIMAHLASLDSEQKRHFAEAEIKVNDRLKKLTKGLLKGKLGELSGLIKGRKSVAKYK